MGRKRNRRVNPEPREKRVNLTKNQLNVRAAVTARQVLAGTIILAETLGKGPTAVRIAKVESGFAVDVGFEFESPDPNRPDLIIRFTPLLGKEQGDITVTPNYHPICSEEFREKVGLAMARIQLEQANVLQNITQDLRGGGG